MAAKPLNCHIRNPVSLRIGDHKGEFNSGCKIIDCSFPNILHPEVGEIHFKNYYTAYLTIKVKFRSKDHGSTAKESSDSVQSVGEMKWQKFIKKLKLTSDPHCENGSQDYYVITRKQFPYDLTNVAAIRLILQQPSPVWKEFRIDDIKFYKTTIDENKSMPLPAWLTSTDKQTKQKKTLEGVPDVRKLSACLQELWSLSEQAAAHQTRTALGRYDRNNPPGRATCVIPSSMYVSGTEEQPFRQGNLYDSRFHVDGCYEINLLSYT